MENLKTSIPGWLLVVAGVLTVAATFMTGGDMEAAVAGLMGALGGVGLIGAKDGSN